MKEHYFIAVILNDESNFVLFVTHEDPNTSVHIGMQIWYVVFKPIV